MKCRVCRNGAKFVLVDEEITLLCGRKIKIIGVQLDCHDCNGTTKIEKRELDQLYIDIGGEG